MPAPTALFHFQIRLTALVLILATMLAVASSPAHVFAWPTRSLSEDAWPTATSNGFAYHVQPPATGPVTLSASAFQIEYGPVFEHAREISSALLASEQADPVDVYVYSNAGQFRYAARYVSPVATPQQTVVLDPGRAVLLVNMIDLLNLSSVQIEDAVRFAVTQLGIRLISHGAAPAAFSTGLALYVQLPTPEEAARMAALVQQADKDNALLPWFDLNRPAPGADTELVRAQSYSIVAFLIDRFDIPTLRSFLSSLTVGTSWPDVMRSVYKNDSATIEQMWRANLKTWTVTGWRDNLMASFDLEPARTLLAQGQYVSAKAVLDPSMNLYRQLNDTTALADVQALVNQADTGIQAEALMVEIETALKTHDYVRASNLLDQATIQYQALPDDQAPGALLATYRQRAADGLTAVSRLAEAERLAKSWGSYPEARAAARDAGATFAVLGDGERLASSHQVMDQLDNRQRRLIALLACLGLITLTWLGLWLRARGRAHVRWSYQ